MLTHLPNAKLAFLAILLSLLLAPGLASAAEPAWHETPAQRDARLAWWRAARFGLFIHWGPVAQTGKEISWSRANTNPKCPNTGPIPAAEYDNLYKTFNPTGFNAAQWVEIAQETGAKYIIPTVKHCDGFLLWDSKASDYNIMQSPFQRDFCRELSDAAHAAGMKIGWYFSPMDWKDPRFRSAQNAEFVQTMQAELTELLTHYGKIDVLWFDTDAGANDYDVTNTYALCRRLQPGIVIDNRLDIGGWAAWRAQAVGAWADYYTPEQVIGGFDMHRAWESCMTVSAHNQWAWGGASDGVKSLTTCLKMLANIVGGDGNMLLNIGPRPDGVIDPAQVDLLKGMGAWLKVNGESIYGTRGGPYKPGPYGACTRKGNAVYIHILAGSGDPILLPPLPMKVTSSALLRGGKAVVEQTPERLCISVPAEARDPADTVVKLVLDGPAMEIPAMSPALRSLTTGKKATASNVYQGKSQYGADKAVDANPDTRWATDAGTHSAWLEVDLGSPQTVSRAIIEQAYPELMRVRKFAIEYWQDGQWKPCYTGADLGAVLAATFSPITAQRLRLNITESSDGPTITEFHLFSR
jgi:alpha-L-fucosidase